jgi:hypothetical protein
MNGTETYFLSQLSPQQIATIPRLQQWLRFCNPPKTCQKDDRACAYGGIHPLGYMRLGLGGRDVTTSPVDVNCSTRRYEDESLGGSVLRCTSERGCDEATRLGTLVRYACVYGSVELPLMEMDRGAGPI